jgi:hypothetical protein
MLSRKLVQKSSSKLKKNLLTEYEIFLDNLQTWQASEVDFGCSDADGTCAQLGHYSALFLDLGRHRRLC